MYILVYLNKIIVYCTILHRQKERQLGELMEGTEEKKDGQTEGQAIRWKKIQQDTKADQSTDERETRKRKDRRKSKTRNKRN